MRFGRAVPRAWTGDFVRAVAAVWDPVPQPAARESEHAHGATPSTHGFPCGGGRKLRAPHVAIATTGRGLVGAIRTVTVSIITNADGVRGGSDAAEISVLQGRGQRSLRPQG